MWPHISAVLGIAILILSGRNLLGFALAVVCLFWPLKR
jgi:hypothetical protein